MKTQKKYILYAGAWAGSKGTAQGIQAYAYDVEKQHLSYIGTYGKYKSMSMVLIDGCFLFSSVESKTEDLIVTYQILDDGSLCERSFAHTNGYGISDIELDRRNHFLFTCNFASCSLSMLSYDENGKLELTDYYQVAEPGSFMAGTSSLKRQDKAYTHCVKIMPDGRHLCMCDMGNDRIYFFIIDVKNRKLIPCPERTVVIDAGEGARNLIFSKSGKYAYLNTEMGNTLYVFRVGKDLSFTRIQKLSTVNSELDNPDKGWCSVTVISQDDRYVYVANRGQNNIAGFQVGPDGSLTLIGFFESYGVSPRNMNFGYDDEVLFVNNNISGDIAVIEYNGKDGRLGRCIQLIDGIPGSSGTVWFEDRGQL